VPQQDILPWVVFNAIIFIFLTLDLTVMHRKAHEVHMKEALLAVAFWVSLALFFCVGVYFVRGTHKALEFLTGYLIEESLSVDNLFVFIMIFTYFKVPPLYQHRVLFWGIVGAVVMRAVFIFAGVSLIHRFHWLIYVFGAFLVYTGIKLAFGEKEEIDPEKNPVLKLFRRLIPVTASYEGSKFFVRSNGKILATPLMVVLVVVETTDVIFATDSIPAILAVTLDPFIVYTSNIFAVLGLRALFFVLAGMMRKFRFLNYGISFILAFVGAKMLVSDIYKFPILVALSVVALVLVLSVAASIRFPEKENMR
jgi:tellurite resistance protein TerC